MLKMLKIDSKPKGVVKITFMFERLSILHDLLRINLNSLPQ